MPLRSSTTETRNWMDPRDDEIAVMRREGATYQQIGDHFGFSRQRAEQICKKLGVTPKTPYRVYQRVFKQISSLARQIEATAEPDDPYFPHGTLRGYRRGCSCDECRRENREWHYRTTGVEVKKELPAAQGPRTRKDPT